jgi:hypothetical protein
MQSFMKFLRLTVRFANRISLACRSQSAKAAARAFFVAAYALVGAAATGIVGLKIKVTSAATITAFRIRSSWIAVLQSHTRSSERGTSPLQASSGLANYNFPQ